MVTKVKEFLGPVDGSVKKEVNKKELARAGVLGAFSWATFFAIAHFLWVALHIVLTVGWDVLHTIATDPTVVATVQEIVKYFSEKNYLAVFVGLGTFTLDVIRRKYMHGTDG